MVYGRLSADKPAFLPHAIKKLRGYKVANDHDKGNITRLRTDCNLVLFSWPFGTTDCDQAIKPTCTYGSSCLEAYYARTRGWCWRQPLVSDSQALVLEMTNLHHLIGRATDIFAPQVIYWTCQCRVHTLCSFICDHVGEPTHSEQTIGA